MMGPPPKRAHVEEVEMDEDDLCLTQPEFIRQVELAEAALLNRTSKAQRLDQEGYGANFQMSNKNVSKAPEKENKTATLLQQSTAQNINPYKNNQMQKELAEMKRRMELSEAETKHIRMSLASVQREKDMAKAKLSRVEKEKDDLATKHKMELLKLAEQYKDQQQFLAHDLDNLQQKYQDEKMKSEELQRQGDNTATDSFVAHPKTPKTVVATRPCRPHTRSRSSLAAGDNFPSSQSFFADVKEHACSSTLVDKADQFVDNLPQNDQQIDGLSSIMDMEAGPSSTTNLPQPAAVMPDKFYRSPTRKIALEATACQTDQKKIERFIIDFDMYDSLFVTSWDSCEKSFRQMLCDSA